MGPSENLDLDAIQIHMDQEMNDQTDLVYILGTGSQWNNNEIRYSMRSVEKNVPHRNIVIVGYLPRFARNVVHVPCRDPYRNKLQNSIHKTAKIVKEKRISERFAIMNDDFFFLKPLEKILNFYKGSMAEMIRTHPTKNGYYFEAAKRTRDMLKEKGIVPKDYSLHYPMILEKRKVARILSMFDHRAEGYLFRTVYANYYNLGGYVRKDSKVKSMPELKMKRIKQSDMISTSDGIAMQSSFREWIHKKFPEPSKYEIEQIEDMMSEGMVSVRYHARKKFTYMDRSYQKGEIVIGPIPRKIVEAEGLIPIWEKPRVVESGGEI